MDLDVIMPDHIKDMINKMKKDDGFEEWDSKIEKAVTDIGKCLDGLKVSEAKLVLSIVEGRYINRAIVRGEVKEEC